MDDLHRHGSPPGEPASGPAPDASSIAATVHRLGERQPNTDRFRALGELARGGMGAILEVFDEDLRRKLAMKVMLRSAGTATAEDTRQVGRFLEEAQVTGQLDHPGIVPVHELGINAQGELYFTMRLVRGESLRQIFDWVHLKREGWTETRALGVMLKVCEAMAYAHQKGVVHRDLKPANVMVGPFGETYVMDWGLARVLGHKDTRDIRLRDAAPAARSLVLTDRNEARSASHDSPLVTMDGDVVGTPAYMPPEQASGNVQQVDARADVYAVGAMLYHLLTGRMPFVPPDSRLSAHAVLACVLHGPPKPIHELNPRVPAELSAICDRAMAREPAARYADMLAMADDLRAYLEQRVVKAYETGALAQLKKWMRRNRALTGACALAVLFLIVGLVTSLTLKSRADRARIEAEAKEALARQERNNVFRLSAFQKLEDLRREADDLWPARPAMIERCEQWSARSRTLLEGLEPNPARHDVGFRAQLAELGVRAKPGSAAGELVFSDDEDRWWHAQLERLVHELEEFADPERGLVRGLGAPFGWGVERRVASARTIAERTITGAEAAARWSEAIDAIADPGQCPAYSGLAIEPQVGLLPLGPDRKTELWEFADLETGDAPVRDREGRLVLTERSGLVFVLLPASTFFMGAQKKDPGGRNYDPMAEAAEAPVHEVKLDAFFLSKFEMTQGQWQHVTGGNPSYFGPGTRSAGSSTMRSPVEQVSWNDCQRVLDRLVLMLPTEAQWEYAARAGTSTPWWTGTTDRSLKGAANLCDAFALRAGVNWRPVEEWLDDGYAEQAPVGTFTANPFGFHEICGNVMEWCRDLRASYRETAAGGDSTVADSTSRIFRDSGFSERASFARSAARGGYQAPDFRGFNLGVRPARKLE